MSSTELLEGDIYERIASVLRTSGFHASATDTGGGTICIVLGRVEGGEIYWGTADTNWGASVITADGSIESAITSDCPSDSADANFVAGVLGKRSLAAGALQNQRN